MPHIELNNVDLAFRIRRHGKIMFKEFVLKKLNPRFIKEVNPVVHVRALNNISLRIDSHERVGIIGHNGAGKSTLLRVLSGIYPPTTGQRSAAGRISSLFDLAHGFHPEATGWENIVLRGYLQGETPRTIAETKQRVADASELGDFLDFPVRCYSSGMLVRLGFALATAIQPEILLLDEVLSAGDLAFQIRARERIQNLMDRAQLVVMVSHDLRMLCSVCRRVIWLDHGQIVADGAADAISAAYQMKYGASPSAAA